jgi:hypothetical protein
MAASRLMNRPAHPALRPGVSLTVFLLACYAGSPAANASVISKNGQRRHRRSVYHGFVSRWHCLQLGARSGRRLSDQGPEECLT